MSVHVEVVRAQGAQHTALRVQVGLGLHLKAEAILAPDQERAVVEMQMPDAPQWWPHGHGAQPLVDLDVHLLADELLDTKRQRIGFRRVELETEPTSTARRSS